MKKGRAALSQFERQQYAGKMNGLIRFLVFGGLSSIAFGQSVPVFEPLFSPAGVQTSVDERAPEGTLVLGVQAQGSLAETIVYGIDLLPSDEGVFVIDSATGDITVGPNGTSRLIIQGGSTTSFVLDAYAYYASAGPDGERAYLMVTVDVRDINDPPVFVEVNTDLAVTEGAAVGYIVHRFLAVDNDLSLNGAIFYSLEQLFPVEVQAHFTIQPFTGDLIITQSLDISIMYELRVIVTDEGVPSLNATLLVMVRVDPVPPVFDDFFYTANVLEFTGDIPVNVTMVTASDGNPADPPGIIEYAVMSWIPENEAVLFEIGATSGVLTVSGTLDREVFSRYVVIVKAYEQGQHPDASSEATVVVQVDDVNEPPSFLSSHYSTSISEGVGMGTVLFTGLVAVDPDEGTNAELSYFISAIEGLATLGGERVRITQPLFFINHDTAVLTVNTSLEREAAVDGFHYYEIIVVVTDRGSPALSANSTVAVTITDINDNPPVFMNLTYEFSVFENELSGTEVGVIVASDSDEGPAASLNFTVIGPFADRFEAQVVSVMHPVSHEARPPVITTGRIVTLTPLDREEIDSYTLTVMAKDMSGFPLNKTVLVVVNIDDRNDNMPQFSRETFTFNVPEEMFGSSTPINQFNVTDADVGSNAEIDFSLEEGVAQQHFSLTSLGVRVQLHLALALDREFINSYSFRIFATDRGSPTLVGETSIFINVTDVNDNAPEFTEETYSVTIAENFRKTSAITTVSASDRDVGSNGELYYVFGQQPPFSMSVDNSTGEVFLHAILDYESIDVFAVEIWAVDFGSPSLAGTTSVIIMVRDENDNSPVFQDVPYIDSVNEDIPVNSEVTIVTATDADDSTFGEVTYSIIDGNMEGKFFLVNTTGSLLLVSPLDRETTDWYSLTVLATDGGNRSSVTTVNITVLDVNDNAPQFVGAPYVTQVSEGFNDSVGVLVFTVRAVDVDQGGINSEVRYSLEGSDRFMVDLISGEVRVSELGVDYERVLDTPYVLTVTAQDLGNISLLSTTTLNVTILDANDHQPVFIGAPYSETVPENITGPYTLLTVTALDGDVSTSGEIEYYISGGMGIFTIDIVTGAISLMAGVTLDREMPDLPHDEDGNAVYTFGVTAVDKGSPVQINDATVSILVSDINDHSPMFIPSNTFIFQVSENLPVAAIVHTFTVIDADFGSNAELNYTLESVPGESSAAALEEDSFSINPASGALMVAQQLDREARADYILIITATDQGIGNNQATATVQISVTDVNDNVPVFSPPPGGYVAIVPEVASQGSEVITVEATDRDLGLHMEITYAINNTNVPFEIADPTVGRITVSGGLDRETNPVYQLIVVAMDTADNQEDILQSYVTVRVIIGDVNDNAPMFGSPIYSGSVEENVPLGTTVQLTPPLTVVDRDNGTNAEVTYRLMGPQSELFSIHPTTGVITTNTTLDLESTSVYSDLLLIARDTGGLMSNASLEILIQDTNDHSPTFTSDTLTLNISELVPTETEITVASAEDLDEGTNGIVTYTLSGEDLNDEFIVSSLTGAISVGRLLDYETRQQYVLNITAQDGGNPPRQDLLIVTVNLQDENDNAPVFVIINPTFSIAENSPVGSEVGQVEAFDIDSGTNAQIVYVIVLGDERFLINPGTGNISTNGTIDREDVDTFVLMVEARNLGPISVVTATLVSIIITDVNDEKPSFPTPPTIMVSEDTEVGTEVVLFSAEDGDSLENSQLTYAIVTSFPEDHFTVNATTGLITTASLLDYEFLSSYTLVVSATDGGQPQLTGNGTLKIFILDENDNAPEFTQDSYDVMLPENTKTDALVTRVIANDEDSASNGNLFYSIIGGNTDSAFRIDNSSGMIYVQNSSALDFEATPGFTVQIAVEDMGDPRLSSLTLLVVTLTDENDNSPEFTVTSQSVFISEGADPGRIVVVLSAVDEDDGTNAALMYFITDGNNEGLFEIMEDGTLVTASQLDYETETMHILSVEAVDGGDPPLSGVTMVTVMITDVNDNAPVFEGEENELVIAENSPVGTSVAEIVAVDTDSGENGEIVYRIVTVGGVTVPFTIGNTTGIVEVDGPLDREMEEKYFILIEVADNGIPSLTTQREFDVIILDVDDHLPEFAEPPVFTIHEDQQLFEPFGILTTIDEDIGENRVAYFYIIGGNAAGLFQISAANGSVYLIQPVDREIESVHVLEIAARNIEEDPGDNCSNSSCTLTMMTVTVLDVNDNPPVWNLPEYHFGVDESNSTNVLVGQVQATDLDATEVFNTVQYRPEIGNLTNLIVDRVTGQIRVNGSFSEEKRATLTVTAFDNLGEEPSLSATVVVKVYLIGQDHLVAITVAETLDDVIASMQDLQSVFDGIEEAIITIHDIQQVTQANAAITTRQTMSRTNIIVFGVSPVTDELFSSSQLLSVVEANIADISQVVAIESVAVYLPPEESDDDEDDVDLRLIMYILIGLAGAILLLCVVFVIALIILARRRKKQKFDPRRLNAARRPISSTSTISAYSDMGDSRNIVQNPMWINPYQNWSEQPDPPGIAYKELSPDTYRNRRGSDEMVESVMYETKEYRMDYFRDSDTENSEEEEEEDDKVVQPGLEDHAQQESDTTEEEEDEEDEDSTTEDDEQPLTSSTGRAHWEGDIDEPLDFTGNEDGRLVEAMEEDSYPDALMF